MNRHPDLSQRRRRAAPRLCGLSLLCTAALACSPFPALAFDLAADAADALAPNTSLAWSLSAPVPVLPEASGLVSAVLPARAARPQEIVAGVADAQAQTVLERALSLLGIPYRWGGTSPERGFDCSGLVKYVFSTALGIELPRVSRDQALGGAQVDRGALVPGDLVFFNIRRHGRGVNHVGIYLGQGQFIHAPRTGKDVMVSPLSGYWSQRFARARRVLGL